jgi:hypothetical protein
VVLAPTRDDLVDAGLLAVLVALALLGLRTSYSGWLYLVAGLVGLLLGIVIAHFANALRQPMIAVAAMTLAVFFLLGGAVALRSTAIGGVLPSGATLHGLADESVHGWKDLLTTLPPVDGGGPLLVLPYILGLLGGVGGLCLARRTKPAFAPVLAPGAVLVMVILLGAKSPADRLLQGAAFGVVALGWAALRTQRLRPPLQNGSGRLMRAVTVGVLLAVAGVGAAVLGPHVPGHDSHQRLVLRNYVAPPFDIGQYPSPLAGFRKYTKPVQDLYDKTLFTVSGLPNGATVRIATLDDYNGLTWAAANRAATAGSQPDTFQRVGTTIDNPAKGTAVTVGVTIANGYSDVWLPSVGAATELLFTGKDAKQHATYFRYNLATGTGVVPDKLQNGDSYTIHAVLDTSALTDTDSVATAGSVLDTASAFLKSPATRWAGTSGTPTTRILALAHHLHDTGKYSDGEPPNGFYLPGHSQVRLTTFVNDPQIVGDDEQFAAAFALMINQLGTPARVVLGAVPESGGTVKGKDVHAWVEVQLADGTWRSISQSVFMNSDSHPEKQPPEQQQQNSGKVVPPPSRIRPRSSLDSANLSNSQSSRNPHKTAAAASGWFTLPAWLITTGTWAGPPVLVILAACALIIGLKYRRRRRRRTQGTPATRFARGWHEVVDHARDLGAVMPGGRTRREQALLLPQHDVLGLARTADSHVFGASAPVEDDVEAYWQEVDRARRQMSRGVGRWRRLRAALSLTSLRKPHGAATGGVA